MLSLLLYSYRPYDIYTIFTPLRHMCYVFVVICAKTKPNISIICSLKRNTIFSLILVSSGNNYPGLYQTSSDTTGLGQELTTPISLQWRHNERDGVSNHQPHDCLTNRLFIRRSKKTSKLRVTGLCEGNSPVTGEYPHKGTVTRKMFPFDDVIMLNSNDRQIIFFLY